MYFNENMIDGAFSTREWSFDAAALLDSLRDRVVESQVEWLFGCTVTAAKHNGDGLILSLNNGREIAGSRVLNATYAGTNALNRVLGIDVLPLKYELCEVVLGRPSSRLSKLGITVMDGPFFSVMPFGHSGIHTATAVGVTPRVESLSELPEFSCQDRVESCTPEVTADCTKCPERPATGWAFMEKLMSLYLRADLSMEYVHSLFTIKTVLSTSEVDDSRPTVIQTAGTRNRAISVFSGKMNTLFDLEDVI